MPKSTALPELLLTRDVAERLGVDVRTVHRWVIAGRLAPVKKMPGRTGGLLFTADAVARLERDLTVAP